MPFILNLLKRIGYIEVLQTQIGWKNVSTNFPEPERLSILNKKLPVFGESIFFCFAAEKRFIL